MTILERFYKVATPDQIMFVSKTASAIATKMKDFGSAYEAASIALIYGSELGSSLLSEEVKNG